MFWPKMKLIKDKSAMLNAAQVIWLGVIFVFTNSRAAGSDTFLFTNLEM